jgi:hypothetical protein
MLNIKILYKNEKKTRCSRIQKLTLQRYSKILEYASFFGKNIKHFSVIPKKVFCAKQIIIYNLRGRKVEMPQAGGLYMKNGKKNIHRPVLKKFTLGDRGQGDSKYLALSPMNFSFFSNLVRNN